MYIVTLKDIIELNQELKNCGFSYKIHLSDSCGKQSMGIEAVDANSEEAAETVKVKTLIQAYFKNKGAGVKFISSGKEFILEE